MAAGILPKPGTKLGPCTKKGHEDGGCGHRDCALTRLMAAQVCRFCGKHIGYGTRFYTDPESKHGPGERPALTHADCLEDAP